MAEIEAKNPPKTQAFQEISLFDGEKRVFRRIDNIYPAKNTHKAGVMNAIADYTAGRRKASGKHNRYAGHRSQATGPANSLNRSDTGLFEPQPNTNF